MGVLYPVIPVNEEVRAWLEEQGLMLDSLDNARDPTPREINAALAQTEIEQEWPDPDIALSGKDGAWTTLCINQYLGEDRPCRFGFSKGWYELVVEATAAISRIARPLLLYPDAGSDILLLHGDRRMEVPDPD